MSLRLRLRLLLSALLGALLVVTVGAALQFREVSTLTDEVLGPDARMLAAAAEMQRLLGEPDRSAEFETAFREQLDRLFELDTTPEGQEVVQSVADAFETWAASSRDARAEVEEGVIRDAVADLVVVTAEQAGRTAESVRNEAIRTAIGLGILAAAVLVFGAWVTRSVRVSLLDRLEAIDAALTSIRRGDSSRRLGLGGDDELGRLAAALDHVLDLRDRAESAMQGRNSELRAMLVALLDRWPRPGAITGIDGEIIASTLSEDQERALRSVTPQLRAAARTLLSRKFVSASELATDLRVDAQHSFAIRALALGEQRILGWVADTGTGAVRGSGGGSSQ